MSVGRYRPDRAIAFASIPVLSLLTPCSSAVTAPSQAAPTVPKHCTRSSCCHSQYIELLPLSATSAHTSVTTTTNGHRGVVRPKYRPASYSDNEPPPRPAIPLGIIQVTTSVVLTTAADNEATTSTAHLLGRRISQKLLGPTFNAYTHPRYLAVDESNNEDSAQAIVVSASRLVRALTRLAGSNSPFSRSLKFVREWHSIPINVIALLMLYHSCFNARWAHLPMIFAIVLVACGTLDSWVNRRTYAMWGPPSMVVGSMSETHGGRNLINSENSFRAKNVVRMVKMTVSSKLVRFAALTRSNRQCRGLFKLVQVKTHYCCCPFGLNSYVYALNYQYTNE
jgi:hypothetical protein